MSEAAALAAGGGVGQQAELLLAAHLGKIRVRTDRLFAGLLLAEWLAEIAWALVRAP